MKHQSEHEVENPVERAIEIALQTEVPENDPIEGGSKDSAQLKHPKIRQPKILHDYIEPTLEVAPSSAPAAIATTAISAKEAARIAAQSRPAAIEGIDDALAVDFSLEKFNSIRFTVGKQIKLFFEHTFPLFVQSIFVPIFFIIYHICFVIKIYGAYSLKHTKGPVIFISNHIGFYDSFIFDLFVRPFSHIMPFRFMGTTRFIVPFLALLKCIGVIDIIYFFFGVFRVTPGEGAEKSLKKAYEIIKNKGTVVMFPEGRIWKPTTVHPEAIGPFKWGAAILAKNTGVQVIPVSFKKTDRTDKNGYMKVRRKIEVHIGKPYFVDPSMTPELIATEMRKKVLELHGNA